MDVIIRDYNGNTLARLRDLLDGEAVAAEHSISPETGNVILTLAAEPVQDEGRQPIEWNRPLIERIQDIAEERERDEEAELEYAERVEEWTNPADDMRAYPDWRL